MNTNGQFWYGSRTHEPGFLYKKNLGVGTRRSTLMGAGGNSTTNTYQYTENKYRTSGNGVGATSIAVRRSKNRMASLCQPPNYQCGRFYPTLGMYNPYLYNPNGNYVTIQALSGNPI